MATSFLMILKDLEVDATDWQTDANAFAARVYEAAHKLIRILDEDLSSLRSTERFKVTAMKNEDAGKQAEEIFNSWMDQVANLDPEVVQHILIRLPELAKTCNSIVTATAMRGTSEFSKGRAHTMYTDLRKGFESYVALHKAMNPDFTFNKTLPSKSGNYSDNNLHGIMEYTFIIGDEEYKNWYTVAKLIGIEIRTYMDVVEWFNLHTEVTLSDGTVAKISMTEMER